MTRPVLVQILKDEFELPDRIFDTLPVSAGVELTSEGELLSEEEKTVYRSGVGELLFLMRCLRPDVLHVARELSKWMSHGATIQHKKVMQQKMKCTVITKNRVLFLKPELTVKNPRTDYFTIKGRADSNHATNPEKRKSASSL